MIPPSAPAPVNMFGVAQPKACIHHAHGRNLFARASCTARPSTRSCLCSSNAQAELKFACHSKRQCGRPHVPAHEGCHGRIKLGDSCFILLNSYGRAHHCYVDVTFHDALGSAISYEKWKQTKETLRTPQQASLRTSDADTEDSTCTFSTYRKGTAFVCGMKIYMVSAGRTHSSSAVVCPAEDLPDDVITRGSGWRLQPRHHHVVTLTRVEMALH